MPGIALGAGVLFLESIITAIMYTAGGWIAQIPDYLLTANVSAIANINKFLQDVGLGELGATVGFGQLPGVPHAFITLAIYSLVFLIVAFYLFRKRDVTG
jgi:ABC-type transport system involved in multi-copper enzyme maturation permease subunit